MENNRIPNIALDAKLDGKMEVVRPKLRWLDDVQADLNVTGIKGWKRKTPRQIKMEGYRQGG
jgi:hypothetical protein